MADQDLQTKLKRLAGRVRGREIDKLAFCLALADRGVAPALPEFALVRDLLVDQAPDERHYWIGAFYTLLLDPDVRRHQAAYFTPPPLARELIALVEAQGCNLKTATVFDPAAGGAAFLSTVAARMRELGRGPRACAKALFGLELDPNLARLTCELVSDRLGGAALPAENLRSADALTTPVLGKMDLVLANPPFGRRMGLELEGVPWTHVASPGHVNIYALFVDIALKWAKPGGLIGMIIPSSFVGGPFYDRLRSHIRSSAHVLALGLVDDRDALFLDVAQDVCLLVLKRRRQGHSAKREVRFGSIDSKGGWNDTLVGTLPRTRSAAWPLPSKLGDASVGGARLTDYGVTAQVGYFVWNRETERMRLEAGPGSVPLFWARNIRAGQVCAPAARKRDGVDYVAFATESSGIQQGPAILLQRTTNSKQRRRLVAGLVGRIEGGFTTENHTILIRPAREDVDLELLCKLLNTAAVDKRYRRLSGTASISAKLLKRLDLPSPDTFAAALHQTADPEAAATLAYEGNVRGQKAA